MDRNESDKNVTFYTGFPNRIVFIAFFFNFGPWKQGQKHKHWHSDDSATVNNRGVMKMSPSKEDQDN